MSQRTKKILSLTKINEEIPSNANDEISERRTSSEFNKSFEEFDPISNWVKEVEPQILKEQFHNAQDSKNSPAVKKRKSSDYLKCDSNKPYLRNENKFYEMSLKSLKSEIEFKPKSENISDKQSYGQLAFFKSSMSCEENNKSDEELSQFYKNVRETVCTQNKAKLYPTTERCLKKLKCDEQNNDGINNMINTQNNFQLPIIVVPPKEAVAHLSVGSDFDLPIILEKSCFISKNDENYLNYSKEGENNVESCLNKFSEKSDNTKVISISSELPKLPQSRIPITKKINVLSQYILRQNETDSTNFITETGAEPNSSDINDIIKFENHCPVSPNVFHTKETDLPIGSDTGLSSIRDEDPYIFESDENEHVKYVSNSSDESENNNSFFNASSDKSDTSEATVEKNIKDSDPAPENSLKIEISSEFQKSVEKDIDNREEEVETTKKKHYKDKKTFCFFCDKDVSHFSRHLTTWHRNEIEVQRLHSYKSKSKERRQALRVLGKRGNYVKNRSTLQLRPVRRVQSGILSSSNEFLPCPHCLGFYKKKSLYRRTKICDSKLPSAQGGRQNSQSEGQTALFLGKFKHDELLQKELFPRMRADDVSLTAKKTL